MSEAERVEPPELPVEDSAVGSLIDVSEAFVRLECRGELYAIELASVREVVSRAPISRIPRAPAPAVGLMNHGGRVYTVVDPAALEMGGDGEVREQVVLLDDPTRLLGITVDQVEGIGPLQVDGGMARFQDRAVAVVELDALVRDIDSAFESASVLVSPKPARSPKEF